MRAKKTAPGHPWKRASSTARRGPGPGSSTGPSVPVPAAGRLFLGGAGVTQGPQRARAVGADDRVPSVDLLIWTPSSDASAGAVAAEAVVSLSRPGACSGRPSGRPWCGWSRNAMAGSCGGCAWSTETASRSRLPAGSSITWSIGVSRRTRSARTATTCGVCSSSSPPRGWIGGSSAARTPCGCWRSCGGRRRVGPPSGWA